MRITRILAKDPGKNIVLDYSYTYDTMDNILSKQTGQGTYNYTNATKNSTHTSGYFKKVFAGILQTSCSNI